MKAQVRGGRLSRLAADDGLDFRETASPAQRQMVQNRLQAGIESPRRGVSASQARRDVLQDRLDDVGVVVDAELVGHGQQQRVGLGDGFVLLSCSTSTSGSAA